jgi:predicted acyltransferase (DUF342 family)
MVVSDPHFYKMVNNLGDEKIGVEVDKVSKLWQDDVEDIPTEEQIVSSYMNLKVAADSENEESTYERAILKTDIRQAASFMAKQAESRSYYVPMEISSDTTMVHMTFRQVGATEKGRISIYTETTQGNISVLMTRREESYSIYAATDSVLLKDKLDILIEGTVVVADNVRDGMWSEMTAEVYGSISVANDTETTYGELVRQAKSFIHNVLKNI